MKYFTRFTKCDVRYLDGINAICILPSKVHKNNVEQVANNYKVSRGCLFHIFYHRNLLTLPSLYYKL